MIVGQAILLLMAILLLAGIMLVPQILFKLEEWSMKFPEKTKEKK